MAIPVGLQLYSVREDAAKDTSGVIAAVAKMGYEAVEFAGYYDHSAAELHKMLEDNGLKCCGTHIGLETLLGDALAGTVEFNRTLGNRFLIVPGLAEERRNSLAAWTETAKVFSEIAGKLKEHGMHTGYHNHAIEFKEMGGGLPWDAFFQNASEDVVMQLDTGNAMHGGGDPVALYKANAKRALTVHLKEYSATDDKALIGEGDTKWEELFAAVDEAGATEWFIVEQESYAHPPMECVELCLKKLREMGR